VRGAVQKSRPNLLLQQNQHATPNQQTTSQALYAFAALESHYGSSVAARERQRRGDGTPNNMKNARGMSTDATTRQSAEAANTIVPKMLAQNKDKSQQRGSDSN